MIYRWDILPLRRPTQRPGAFRPPNLDQKAQNPPLLATHLSTISSPMRSIRRQQIREEATSWIWQYGAELRARVKPEPKKTSFDESWKGSLAKYLGPMKKALRAIYDNEYKTEP